MSKITITGYESDCNCEHCGRKLKHGIKIEQNGLTKTVGAHCLANDMTKPQEYQGRKYRLPANDIIEKAKWLEYRSWEWLTTWKGFTLGQITFEAI
jgi:ribosome-binding protein aMBF1 (putative translation factor)